MNSKAILRCLPLLADVLGRAYGVSVEIGGGDAYTTGRVIRLPSLPASGDATFLGLVRGYIDHEAAHVRHTDFQGVARESPSPLERHVWNIFEDWRVEGLLGALFPGCRSNFAWLIRHLFGASISHPRPPVHVLCSWLLLTVRSWSVPDLNSRCTAEKDALDRLWPGLTAKVEPILAAMQSNCPDSLACLKYARQVLRCLPETPPPPASGLDLQAILTIADEQLPDDLGEILKESLGRDIPADSGLKVARMGEKTRLPLSQQDLDDIAQVTAGLRARFEGMLQSSRLVRRRPARRGRLDPRNVHGVVIGNPRIFLATERKQAVNTAVHILVDSSASMQGRMGLTSQCCSALAQALIRSGISVGITAFPGNPAASSDPTVVPVLRHGDRLHGNLAVEARGQTPLGESLWWVLQQLVSLPEERKLVLILTDGAPDNLLNAKEAIQAGNSVGVEIYGLGIEAPQITQLLPRTSQNINRLGDLPGAVFSLLGQALVQTRRAA